MLGPSRGWAAVPPLVLLIVAPLTACTTGPEVTDAPPPEPHLRAPTTSAPGPAGPAGVAPTPAPSTTKPQAVTTTTTEPEPTTTTSSPDGDDPDPDEALTGLAGGSIAYVNDRRDGAGLAPLTEDPDLTAMAVAWAEQMGDDQTLRHNPNLAEQSPARFRATGENVAYSSDASAIDDMWWNSDGHRANIMGPSYTHIGVAFVEDGSGVTWAVQVFAG